MVVGDLSHKPVGKKIQPGGAPPPTPQKKIEHPEDGESLKSRIFLPVFTVNARIVGKLNSFV